MVKNGLRKAKSKQINNSSINRYELKEKNQKRPGTTEGFKHSITLRGLVTYFLCGSVVLALFACSLFYVTHWDGCFEWTFRVHVHDQHTMSLYPTLW